MITCRQCKYMQITGHTAITARTNPAGPKGFCYCQHPMARKMFFLVNPWSPKEPCFIASTKPGGDKPEIKTHPKWCPLIEDGGNP